MQMIIQAHGSDLFRGKDFSGGLFILDTPEGRFRIKPRTVHDHVIPQIVLNGVFPAAREAAPGTIWAVKGGPLALFADLRNIPHAKLVADGVIRVTDAAGGIFITRALPVTDKWLPADEEPIRVADKSGLFYEIPFGRDGDGAMRYMKIPVHPAHFWFMAAHYLPPAAYLEFAQAHGAIVGDGVVKVTPSSAPSFSALHALATKIDRSERAEAAAALTGETFLQLFSEYGS